MRTTDYYILKELRLSKGQILTLEELEARIIAAIDEEHETNLEQGMDATEVLDMKYYSYCIDDDYSIDKVYFEVINNTSDIDSIIKII